MSAQKMLTIPHPRSAPVRPRVQVTPTLAWLTLLLAMFPYITIPGIGVPSEVQPWAAIFAWVSMVILISRGTLKIYHFYIFLFVFAIFFLFYVRSIDSISSEYYLRKSSSFILSVPIVLVIQHLRPLHTVKLIKFASIIWLAFALFGYLLPNAYLELVKPIIPTALGAYGERGVTSLAPEATDFGFTMACFFALYLVAARSAFAGGYGKQSRWPYFVIALNVLLSLSASGLFALVFIISAYLISITSYKSAAWKFATYSLSALAAVVAYLTLLMIDETGMRGLDLLITAIQDPRQLVNTTFSYRLAHNLTGIYGFIDSSLIGYGAGSFVELGSTIYYKYRIGELIGVEGWYAANIPLTLDKSPLAFFPVIIFEYGVMGLAYCAIVFSKPLRSNVHLKLVIFVVLILTWGQSFPAAFPMFWILLGLCVNQNFSRTKARVYTS